MRVPSSNCIIILPKAAHAQTDIYLSRICCGCLTTHYKYSVLAATLGDTFFSQHLDIGIIRACHFPCPLTLLATKQSRSPVSILTHVKSHREPGVAQRNSYSLQLCWRAEWYSAPSLQVRPQASPGRQLDRPETSLLASPTEPASLRPAKWAQ